MLHIAPGFDIPDDAVTETFAILAKKRVGKSNAAVVFANESGIRASDELFELRGQQ
jgi:hypothetical protein